MELDRPIFVLGPHRSGTTLVYRVLARHPVVGFPNHATKRFPRSPLLAHWLTRLGFPDEPREAQHLWDLDRTRDDDVMTGGDCTSDRTQWYRHTLVRILELRGARRLVAKYPRLSFRVDWLDHLFPDAVFVHVTRDWRAVVNSTSVRRHKRDGRSHDWFGVYPPGWREFSDLPHDEVATHLFVRTTEVLEKERERLGKRVFPLAYEDLCANPLEAAERLVRAVGLEWNADFAQSVDSMAIKSANAKWRTGLGADRADELRQIAPQLLGRYEAEAAHPEGSK